MLVSPFLLQKTVGSDPDSLPPSRLAVIIHAARAEFKPTIAVHDRIHAVSSGFGAGT
jgi:hypothetical protein